MSRVSNADIDKISQGIREQLGAVGTAYKRFDKKMIAVLSRLKPEARDTFLTEYRLAQDARIAAHDVATEGLVSLIEEMRAPCCEAKETTSSGALMPLLQSRPSRSRSSEMLSVTPSASPETPSSGAGRLPERKEVILDKLAALQATRRLLLSEPTRNDESLDVSTSSAVRALEEEMRKCSRELARVSRAPRAPPQPQSKPHAIAASAVTFLHVPDTAPKADPSAFFQAGAK